MATPSLTRMTDPHPDTRCATCGDGPTDKYGLMGLYVIQGADEPFVACFRCILGKDKIHRFGEPGSK